jgi:hypothetical protein
MMDFFPIVFGYKYGRWYALKKSLPYRFKFVKEVTYIRYRMGDRTVPCRGTPVVMIISLLSIFDMLTCCFLLVRYDSSRSNRLLTIPIDFKVVISVWWEILSKTLLRSKKIPNVLFFYLKLKFKQISIVSCVKASSVPILSLNPNWDFGSIAFSYK